jgi:hypothetical protein
MQVARYQHALRQRVSRIEWERVYDLDEGPISEWYMAERAKALGPLVEWYEEYRARILEQTERSYNALRDERSGVTAEVDPDQLGVVVPPRPPVEGEPFDEADRTLWTYRILNKAGEYVGSMQSATPEEAIEAFNAARFQPWEELSNEAINVVMRNYMEEADVRGFTPTGERWQDLSLDQQHDAAFAYRTEKGIKEEFPVWDWWDLSKSGQQYWTGKFPGDLGPPTAAAVSFTPYDLQGNRIYTESVPMEGTREIRGYTAGLEDIFDPKHAAIIREGEADAGTIRA